MKNFISIKIYQGELFINVDKIIKFSKFDDGSMIWLEGVEKPIVTSENTQNLLTKINDALQ